MTKLLRRVIAAGGLLALIAFDVAAGAPAATAAPATVAPVSPGCLPRKSPPAVGINELSRSQLSSRLLDLRLYSHAMQGTQNVRMLLPANYDASGATRYPVLYLLHGFLGNYTNYATNGIEARIGDRPVIVVMPDDGIDGSYSDWFGMLAGSIKPPPAWETYHLRELVPFVDAAFPTTGAASGRFIAGISSGGSGAMKYAAANPGMFGAAGAISGAVDITVDYPFYPIISEALWGVTLIPTLGPAGHCTWGDPFTQQVVWEDNNPRYLAANLKGTALFLSCGNGEPGPYNPDGSTDPTELEVWTMNQRFAAALDTAGIAHTDDFYGPGAHTWPYFGRELDRFIAWLTPKLGAPVIAPAAFDLRSARPAFAAWGWAFTLTRPVREFAYLEGVSAAGFVVRGSGRLDVVSAPLYSPGAAYRASGQPVVADASGRIRFAVDMGPSHLIQQLQLDDAKLRWPRRLVEIRAVS